MRSRMASPPTHERRAGARTSSLFGLDTPQDWESAKRTRRAWAAALEGGTRRYSRQPEESPLSHPRRGGQTSSIYAFMWTVIRLSKAVWLDGSG